MFDRRFVATLLAGTLLAGSAVAQTSGTGTSGTSGTGTAAPTQMTPDNSGSSTGTNMNRNTGSSTGTTTGAGTTAQTTTTTTGAQRFASGLQANQWLASKLMDQTVYSADNQNVGDINDLVLDRSGNIQSVVIGVGGFLGIGEKNVAVPFNAIEVSHNPNSSTSSTSGTSTSGTTASGTSGTSSSTTAANNNGSPTGSSSMLGGSTDRLVLRMTKQDLQNAPTFRSDRNDSAASGSSSDTTTGTRNGTSGTTTVK